MNSFQNRGWSEFNYETSSSFDIAIEDLYLMKVIKKLRSYESATAIYFIRNKLEIG